MTTTDDQHATTDRSPLGLARWGDAALGTAVAAEEATAGLIRELRRAAEWRRQRLTELAERGAVERARYRRRTTEAAEAAVTAVAASPLIDRVVDRQLQRLLRPVVRAVLDDVLLLLEKEPERIQTLIRGQRESMVDELVGRLRAGADAGDTAVDRLTFRVFHRAPRPEPAPPPDL
ncbi:hypothetical protein AB0368_29295 [Actinoplanes sp. NPDC051475]|uniref:hypothetical protein n=1 Tax=Actinoplanes sp. NPDC051475 TaxID=3157225 RepID=UPI00344B466F